MLANECKLVVKITGHLVYLAVKLPEDLVAGVPNRGNSVLILIQIHNGLVKHLVLCDQNPWTRRKKVGLCSAGGRQSSPVNLGYS